MKLQNKYKIALVGYRLGVGGAERVMANLSVYFDAIGIEVHIVTVIDEFGYEYKGEVFSTAALKKGKEGMQGRIRRMVGLYRFFRKERFDYIIDFRFRLKKWEELFIAKWLYNAPSIYTIHSSKLSVYVPENKQLARCMYKNAYGLVAISEGGREQVESEYGLTNVSLIYNPIRFDLIEALKDEEVNLPFDYIIGVGQLENNVKQFDHLIRAYASSRLKTQGIHLVICGDGALLDSLKALSVSLNIDDFIHFVGFQSNPFNYMRAARFLVLSSAFEGFSMVLVEALACGTPVVSYDCEHGPSEIILHEENGLLVENQNKGELERAMVRLIEDRALYASCKANARVSVARFSLETIGAQWLTLMNLK